MARGQRCCLISPAGEGVDDAEGGGDARCAVDKLPRPTEVEAPLEIRACALEISATQVDKSESKPPEVQRKGMIGLCNGRRRVDLDELQLRAHSSK
jgi:hypothetical protein